MLFLLFFFLASGIAFSIPAQDSNSTSLSFWYPIVANGQQDTTSFNFGLFYSRLNVVKGADLTLIASRITEELHGYQGTYVYSRVDGSVQGLQGSGIVSSINGSLNGSQGAGIYSYTSDSVHGIQGAGIVGRAGGSLRGLQASGIASFTAGSVSGIQAAGILSTIKGELNGIQGAGIVSYTTGNINGGQFGFINIARKSLTGTQYGFINLAEDFVGLRYGFLNISDNMHGLPIGFANIADTMNGLQIGLINIAEQINGVPIGLLNIAGNGDIKGIVYTSTPSLVNAGAKFIVNNFYSIVSAGGYDIRNENEEYASFSWHYGYQVPLGRFYIGADIGNQILFERTDSDFDEENIYRSYQARLLAGVDLTDWLGIFGGIGGGWEHRGTTDFDDGTGELVYTAGITVF